MTALDEYFELLHKKGEKEMTALAEGEARDPSRLVEKFRESVKMVAERNEIAVPFYEQERRDPASYHRAPGLISKTIEFASHLSDGHVCDVAGSKSLSFRYVDREIFPGRTREKESSGQRRFVDLLLANSTDRRPVLAELKIGGDQLAYYALIQLLMLAAQFQSKSQRDRLVKHAAGKIEIPAEGPFVDIYMIAFRPDNATYRNRSFEATKEISERLLTHTDISASIRRIAYIEASVDGEALKFEKRFAFGAGV